MYIAQAFKYRHSWWMYAIPLAGFLGLSVLNYLVIVLLDMDVDQIMKERMEQIGSNWTFAEMLAPMILFLAALFIWVLFVHKQPLRALTTARKKVHWGRVFFGFAIIFVATGVITAIDYYMAPEDFVIQFQLGPFLFLAVIAILLVPIQTSYEEYFFRGYLMQGIGVLAKNRWVPLLITSVIFGGMHILNPEVGALGMVVMIYYIGTGLFLGIMTLMDEGMELALGFHAGNNIAAALMITSDWTVFQTNSILKDISEPSGGWDIVIWVFIVYPIFLGLMAWRYKWKNWKEKLFGRVVPPPEETSVSTS